MPVINKIDLPSAEPERVISEIEDVIGIEAQDAPQISAKTGLNVDAGAGSRSSRRCPPLPVIRTHPLQALIFDSVYDSYKGVIVFLPDHGRHGEKGHADPHDGHRSRAEVVEVGYFGAGQFIPCEELAAGMVGYITASIKNVRDTRVGDTMTDAGTTRAHEPLPGYKKVNPMVYCGMYPADGAKYPRPAGRAGKAPAERCLPVQFEPETSVALGFGFRCGFLGLLHLEIIQERLEREYNLDLVTTAPSVIYKVHKTNGEVHRADQPDQPSGPVGDRIYGRTDCESGDHGNHRVCRPDHGAVPGAPGRCTRAWNIWKQTRAVLQVRAAAE